MRSYDTFVMTVPKAPYRCPPGPYERACVVADYLKRKGRTGAKVVVLDANRRHHRRTGSLRPRLQRDPCRRHPVLPQRDRAIGGFHHALDHHQRQDRQQCQGAELHPQPARRRDRAGWPLNSTGFVPVNPLTYGIAGYPNIHVIGDSCAVPSSDGKAVPKSGHMANSEAKICADAIIRSFNGEAPDQDIATSSACFSPITNKTSSWLSTNFIYGDIFDARRQREGQRHAPRRPRRSGRRPVDGDSYQDMFIWADSMFADSYA